MCLSEKGSYFEARSYDHMLNPALDIMKNFAWQLKKPFSAHCKGLSKKGPWRGGGGGGEEV